MNRKSHLAALSLLMFVSHGAAFSANTESPYPADAEASFSPAALDTYANQQARKVDSGVSESWGVGQRQAPKPHDPFPFGGGPVDD